MNKEQKLEYNRKYAREHNREYYQANKEDIKRRQRERYGSTALVQKAYRLAHVEEIKKWAKEYGKRPEKIFKVYQYAARRRGISFLLTYEQFLTFWQKPCFYGGHRIGTIGLDRINNDVGYEMTNVVPCCKVCNYMKADMSQDEFREHIRSISF